MRRVENHCCDCAVPGHPCDPYCSLKHVEIWYCDECGEEIYGDVYNVDGDDLCEECLKEKFRKEI